MSGIDKNCLSHWFPKIEAADLPVPETRIVRTELDLTSMLDGETVAGVSGFLGELRRVADAIGYPVFLRTGHGSGKHDWDNTCYVTSSILLPEHVHNLVEWSCTVDVFGLPTNVWAVREMLPTKPLFTAFRSMPICREFRVFVDGLKIVCVHPYWPRAALIEGFPWRQSRHYGDGVRDVPDDFDALYESLCELRIDDRTEMFVIASLAGEALGGQWSVDVIDTERGWYLTDMAEAHRSFHWEGCPEAQRFEVSDD